MADGAGGKDGATAAPPRGCHLDRRRLLTGRGLADAAVVGFVLGLVLVNMCGAIAAVFSLHRKWAWVFLAVVGLLDLLPLRIAPPRPVRAFLHFFLNGLRRHLSAVITFEDEKAIQEAGPVIIGKYAGHVMIGKKRVASVQRLTCSPAATPCLCPRTAYEPHSVLPIGMAMFSSYSGALPPGVLSNMRVLVSSAFFFAGIAIRNIWWWIGCRPASRPAIRHLLAKGTSVLINPGGIQECLYLARGEEHIFLKRRRGFVRVALEQGAALVPAWGFGQTPSMSYWRPGLDFPQLLPRRAVLAIARTVRFFPMLAWGIGGTPVPYQVKLTIVVGKPIRVPKTPAPSTELVDEYLQRFIAEMERLFEEHKAAAGYAGDRLVVH